MIELVKLKTDSLKELLLSLVGSKSSLNDVKKRIVHDFEWEEKNQIQSESLSAIRSSTFSSYWLFEISKQQWSQTSSPFIYVYVDLGYTDYQKIFSERKNLMPRFPVFIF